MDKLPSHSTPNPPSRIPILISHHYMHSAPTSCKVVKNQADYLSIPCRIPRYSQRRKPVSLTVDHSTPIQVKLQPHHLAATDMTKTDHLDCGKEFVDISNWRTKVIHGLVSKVVSKFIDGDISSTDCYPGQQDHAFCTPSLDRKSKARFHNAHSFWKNIELDDRPSS